MIVISDVDGTLVTQDKRLSAATQGAVAELRRRGIGFTVVSSRPPFGLRMLVEPLHLDLPMAAFNGGMLVAPDLTPIEQHVIDAATARLAIELLDAAGVAVWLFTAGAWHVRDPAGDYVAREQRTVLVDPVPVADFTPFLAAAGKIVGVSRDFARLETLEAEARAALAGHASVVRSQNYYLDVTPMGTDKGTAVAALLRRTGTNPEELIVLGDMENDLPMFRDAAFSIAMGNANAEVKDAAGAVTRSNDEDGFAHAVQHLILPRIYA
ncbi:MAG: Cof-type HAD-IIB family hydrolase [Stellaceae bacterium]